MGEKFGNCECKDAMTQENKILNHSILADNKSNFQSKTHAMHIR